MKYKLIGKHKGGEPWDFAPEYPTRAEAERQMQAEINAYTYNGACDWEFEIIEVPEPAGKILTEEQAKKILTMLKNIAMLRTISCISTWASPARTTDQRRWISGWLRSMKPFDSWRIDREFIFCRPY